MIHVFGGTQLNSQNIVKHTLKKSVSYIACFSADGKWTVKKKNGLRGRPCSLKSSITQHSLLLGQRDYFFSEVIVLARRFYWCSTGWQMFLIKSRHYKLMI